MPFSSSEVVKYFNATFNVSGRTHNPFQRMLDKYKEIFKEEIDRTDAILVKRHAGKTMQGHIGKTLKLYDNFNRNKQHIDRLPEEERL